MKKIITSKTCLVYSSGGHYAELKRAISGIDFFDVYHLTFPIAGAKGEVDNVERRIFITHPRRQVFRTLRNAFEAFFILLRERPRLIISTGADVAVPTLIIGKLIFRCKVIFIESAGDITPTLTGRLVYPFCDLFIVQWREKLAYFPKAVLSKGLLL